jgi:hypothetical protein
MTYCDGLAPEIVSSLTCDVPINILRSSPLSHDWGSSITAIIKAINLYGESDFSDPGNGAVILTYPDAPIDLIEDIVPKSAS